MKIKNGYIKTRAVEGWVVAPVGKESLGNHIMLTLNETAAEIWDGLAEGKESAEIAASLVQHYGIGTALAEKNVASVVEILSCEGILA